jgi:hypothetical protein
MTAEQNSFHRWSGSPTICYDTNAIWEISVNTPGGEAVSDLAVAHLERIDEAVFELKAVFKDHHDRRDSVLRESDTTPQGEPGPPAEVADLVADEGEDQPEQ